MNKLHIGRRRLLLLIVSLLLMLAGILGYLDGPNEISSQGQVNLTTQSVDFGK